MAAGLGLAFSPRASGATDANPVLAVPIKLDASGPWTGVWLNGVGPFRFRVVSSGNVFTVSQPLAERLTLPRMGDVPIAEHNRDRERVIYRADSMSIGGALNLRSIRLLARDDLGLSGSWQGTLPIPSDRVTAFDFGAGEMRYSPKPAGLDGYGQARLQHYDVGLGWAARMECRFVEKPVRLGISTSSPASVVLSPDAVKRLKLWDGSGPFAEDDLGYNGRPGRRRFARRGDLEIGGVRFERPVVELSDPLLGLADANDGLDGYVGMDVMRRLDFAFEPPKDRLWLRPNATIHEPWRYDRAGFAWTTDAGVWRVSRLHAGAPAARAGLMVGDRLKPDPAFVDRLTGKAGDTVMLEIERDGRRLTLPVKLEEWL